jgi:hypothetical protein
MSARAYESSTTTVFGGQARPSGSPVGDARDYGVQKHHGQRYGHVHAHRYYVRRGYVLPRGGGLLGCRHWSPIGVYWTCYFW